MLDSILVLVLLMVVVGLISEINELASKMNRPKRGRGRPRKNPIVVK